MKKLLSITTSLLIVLTMLAGSFIFVSAASDSEASTFVTYTKDGEQPQIIEDGGTTTVAVGEAGKFELTSEKRTAPNVNQKYVMSDKSIAFISSSGNLKAKTDGQVTVDVYATNSIDTKREKAMSFTLVVGNGGGPAEEPAEEPVKDSPFLIKDAEGVLYGPENPIIVQGSEYKDLAFYTKDGTQITSGIEGAVSKADESKIYVEPDGSYFNFTRPGEADITFTYAGNSITVRAVSRFVPVSSFTIESLPSEIKMDKLMRFIGYTNNRYNFIGISGTNLSPFFNYVKILPENASFQNIQWSSSDESVATYMAEHNNGFLGHDAGTTQIKGTISQSLDGHKYADDVTAVKEVVFSYQNPVSQVSTPESEIELGVNEKKDLDIRFVPEKPSQTEILWTQSGDGEVTVTHAKPGENDIEPTQNFSVKGTKQGNVKLVGVPLAKAEGTSPEIVYSIKVKGTSAEKPVSDDAADLIKESSLKYFDRSDLWIGYGGEWNIMTLSKAGMLTDTQKTSYLDALKTELEREGGKLSPDGKPTDFARVILTLAELGIDPRDFYHTDLLNRLLNSDGIEITSNEAVWALQTLNSLRTDANTDEKWNKESLIKEILKHERPDGSISLDERNATGSTDMTAMAIQSLAPYNNMPEVSNMIENGLNYLKSKLEDGYNYNNPESTAQLIIAISSLGIDPLKIEGFHEDGKSLFDAISPFVVEGKGIKHDISGDVNNIASYQALLSVLSYEGYKKTGNSFNIYDAKTTLSKYPGSSTPADNSGNHENTNTGDNGNIDTGNNGNTANGNIANILKNNVSNITKGSDKKTPTGRPGALLNRKYSGSTSSAGITLEVTTLAVNESIEQALSRLQLTDDAVQSISRFTAGYVNYELQDISFIDKNKNNVTVHGTQAVLTKLSIPTDGLEIYHITGNGELEKIDSFYITNDGIEFSNDSFSPYLFVSGPKDNKTIKGNFEETLAQDGSNVGSTVFKNDGSETVRTPVSPFIYFFLGALAGTLIAAFIVIIKKMSSRKTGAGFFTRKKLMAAASIALLLLIVAGSAFAAHRASLRQKSNVNGPVTTENVTASPKLSEKNASSKDSDSAKTVKKTNNSKNELSPSENPEDSKDGSSSSDAVSQGDTASQEGTLSQRSAASRESADKPKPKKDVAKDGGQEADAASLDQYHTSPVPEGKPAPVDTPATTSSDITVYISVDCKTILRNMDRLQAGKEGLVPSDGIIVPRTAVTVAEGTSAFDALELLLREEGIHMEYEWTPMYNSNYVSGINNLYEFDCGGSSGWMYNVNGWYPNYGLSRYELHNGDELQLRYTCEMGDL